MRRAVITLSDNDIAPRLDFCLEVVVAEFDDSGRLTRQETLVLAEPSADEICRLILSQRADVLVCGGIEEEHYQYLAWKKVEIMDGVIGQLEAVLERLADASLTPGAILSAD